MSEVEIVKSAREQFEEALLELVGDNVGRDCDCRDCKDNRDVMRQRVAALIKEESEKH